MSTALAHAPVHESKLLDSFNRNFNYLRLSLTDLCNFRCVYCLPHGLEKHRDSAAPLSVQEIKHLVIGLSQVGMKKIRLTGGEPLLPKRFVRHCRYRSPTFRTLTISPLSHKRPSPFALGCQTKAARSRRDQHQSGLSVLGDLRKNDRPTRDR